MNPILATDGYKPSHKAQMVPGTGYETSYIEARGSKDPDFDFVFVAGIQAYIQKYLQVPFTQGDLDEAKEIFAGMGAPFDYDAFAYILKKNNGFFPVEIKALPEGTLAPLSVPLIQITNTDPKCAWVPAYLETALLRAIWYPSTVATNAMVIRNVLKAYAAKSATDVNVDFKLVDFGARGVSSGESAGIGGTGFLMTGFMATDTVEAVLFARKYYGAKIAGFTIPASQHSTVTPFGQANEDEAYRQMMRTFGGKNPDGSPCMYANVIDSFDDENAAGYIWGEQLKQDVIDDGAIVILRPDSGDPLTVPIKIIEILMNKFGFSTNAKGYRVLPDYIRVIQGDGITKDSIKKIIANLNEAKISLDNIAFGMGGGMLQLVNRDTLQFAMKTNEIVVNGERRDVYKRPQGDAGKASKAGAQSVVNVQGKGLVAMRSTNVPEPLNELKVVYDSGFASPKWVTTLDEIRARANG